MKIKDQKNTKTQIPKLSTARGFTLIEIMVAVTVFSLVMIVSMGAVLSIVSANKKSQAINSSLNNLNFAVEGMIRDLRTGYDYSCGGGDVPQDCASTPESQLKFVSAQQGIKDVVYGLSNGRIYKKIDGGTEYYLTAREIVIDRLDFYVRNTPNGTNQDKRQPMILISIQGHTGAFGSLTNLNLQVMVSQRKLDV